MADITLPRLFNNALEYAISGIHTAIPARISKIYAPLKKIDAQPTIKKLYKDGTTEIPPVITGIPLLIPGCKNVNISMPIQVGDGVLLIFCERSLDQWIASKGDVVDPLDSRKHDISDAFAIPGLNPYGIAGDLDPDDFVISYGGALFKIKKDGTVEITGASTFTGDMLITGNLVVTGTITTGSLDLTTHKHTDPQGGFVGPPINGP